MAAHHLLLATLVHAELYVAPAIYVDKRDLLIVNSDPSNLYPGLCRPSRTFKFTHASFEMSSSNFLCYTQVAIRAESF